MKNKGVSHVLDELSVGFICFFLSSDERHENEEGEESYLCESSSLSKGLTDINYYISHQTK